MHICIITSSKVFDGAIGGEGKYSLLLSKWLVDNSNNVTLIGSDIMKIKTLKIQKNYVHSAQSNNEQKKVKVSNIPYFIFMLFRIFTSLRWVIKLISINLSSPITLIHAQDTGYSALAAIMAGRILRIPVITSSHGIRHKTIEHSLKGKLKKIIYKLELKLDIFTISNSDIVITDNKSIKNYFVNLVSKEIEHIPIPISLVDYRYSESNRKSIHKELGIDENIKSIGFIGRFAPEKNIISLLTAFYNVLQNNKKIKLVLVGSGPLESDLKNFVKKKGIEDYVIFCGIRQDINRILSGLDIFILPSYTEGMSISLLEAMATGRTIICSNIPTNAEIITHNEEGIHIDPYKINSIEQAITNTLNDDKFRCKLGQNAKSKAIHFDINMVFPKIFHLYKKVLEIH
jgi:glycosyltransferase involved in cell wall biosynthesis